MVKVYDIMLDDIGDLAIKNGDLLIGESTLQHQRLLLLTAPAGFKQTPLLGIDVGSYINDDDSLDDFHGATDLISIDNSELIYFLFHQVEFLEGFEQEKTSLIISLIKQSHFKKKEYLKLIDDVFRFFNNTSSFEKVICTFADIYPFHSFSQQLASSINKFNSSSTIEFDVLIIKLLVHSKPKYRFIGQDFFGEISSHQYRFTYDILLLEPLNQYKLWVSILQSYREPKLVLPCLIPLLKSKSGLVKEAFICKLEEYSENYGSGVKNVLKRELDLEAKKEKYIYDRIENYQKEHLSSSILIKQDIKELSPFYAQNKLISEYNNSYYRIFSRKLQRGTKENSVFLSHIKTIKLLKGGGWKMQGKEKISKLGNVSTGFSLPRNYFIEPENFDFENSLALSHDWDDSSFDELKKFIENE